MINDKSNQQNGNPHKALETAKTPNKSNLEQHNTVQTNNKKHVYSLDSSTMKKDRSDQEDSKNETHPSFAEKFQNNQKLNLKIPDYAIAAAAHQDDL